MSQKKIVVIGGGAAGLMAAGQATSLNVSVVLFEKMKNPGRKICITGKGRCNITNIAQKHDFIEHFGKTGRFLHQAFSHFFSPELITYFKECGLELVIERGGRVFPANGDANEVLKVMLNWLKQKNVQILNNSTVENLIIKNNILHAIICNGKEFPCDAAILTTGGCSYPATGSNGEGFILASQAGHNIIPVRPALVPLETNKFKHSGLNGLNLKNIMIRVYCNGKKKKQLFGEMTFTDFGVSGPIILTLSGFIVDCLQDKQNVMIAIDMKPALDDKKLDARLIRDFSSRNKEPLESVLRGLLPQQLVLICLGSTGISANKPVHQVSAKERTLIRNWLKNFRLEITGYRSFKEAIVTAGGVDTREINPNTMESKLVKGLYMAGEILDIQGDTGGYNLQAAFSTGWLAGRSSSKRKTITH